MLQILSREHKDTSKEHSPLSESFFVLFPLVSDRLNNVITFMVSRYSEIPYLWLHLQLHFDLVE